MATSSHTTTQASALPAHLDVLVVGAGISGIGMGRYLAVEQPGQTFAIVDSRDAIGGTWDLFRYPGIRSDSDLHTFGYAFKPWTNDNAIADAHEILTYLQEAIDENSLQDHIHLGLKVARAEWSTQDARWTVTLEPTHGGEPLEVTCSWLFSAAGYYDYAGGYTPDFEGREDFAGTIVHPQDWPEDLDYAGKKIVVIGSGATAVTLIPALAETADHVTMLQRSPSYVLPIPRQDAIANTLRRLLPDTTAYALTRRLNIGRQRLIYNTSQRHPRLVRRLIRATNAKALPDGYPVDVHFKPTYDPWDQRLCAVPDSDMFKTISRGQASVVTDKIVRFTERGILLESGQELDADIIVTATGLNVLAFGGIELSVDGEKIDLSNHVAYKSFMLSGIPNFAFSIGYTNSSWTLKVDLVCAHLCRLLAYMDVNGYAMVTPVAEGDIALRPLLDFPAGYVLRAADQLPKQGDRGPWTVEMSFAADRKRLRNAPVDDAALLFGTAGSRFDARSTEPARTAGVLH